MENLVKYFMVFLIAYSLIEIFVFGNSYLIFLLSYCSFVFYAEWIHDK